MNIEADSGGGLQYGGEFRRRISISRRSPGADCNMEADFGGGLQYESEFRGRIAMYGVGRLRLRTVTATVIVIVILTVTMTMTVSGTMTEAHISKVFVL